jgi:urea-proton symporter
MLTFSISNPMLAGNVVALLSPCIFVPILTYALKPQNYDWQSMKEIRKADDHDLADAAHVDLELIPGGHAETAAEEEAEQANLLRAVKISRWMTVGMTLALLVLWPFPMYGSSYIFSKKFFTGWVVVGILWMFLSAFCVGLYPLYEGRHTMVRTFKAIVGDVTGKKPAGPIRHDAEVVGEEEEGSGAATPTEKGMATEKVASPLPATQ